MTTCIEQIYKDSIKDPYKRFQRNIYFTKMIEENNQILIGFGSNPKRLLEEDLRDAIHYILLNRLDAYGFMYSNLGGFDNKYICCGLFRLIDQNVKINKCLSFDFHNTTNTVYTSTDFLRIAKFAKKYMNVDISIPIFHN